MTVEVEVGGRTRVVSVERTDRPGRFRVTVDGVAHVVDAMRTGDFGVSLLATVPVSGRDSHEKGTVPLSREVQLTPAGMPGELLVNMDGRVAAVTVNGRRTGHAADTGSHGHGDVPIVAPMPGRVVRVLVAPGDPVEARQGVVIVEAMKMENELRAPRGGRVKEISVAPGASVEAGRVLAVIE